MRGTFLTQSQAPVFCELNQKALVVTLQLWFNCFVASFLRRLVDANAQH